MRQAKWMLMAGALLASSAIAAQNFPTKPVRVIVPFSAGGATDIVTRVVAQKLTETWGQTIVVDNRAGAGGNIGADLAAKIAGRRLYAVHDLGLDRHGQSAHVQDTAL